MEIEPSPSAKLKHYTRASIRIAHLLYAHCEFKNSLEQELSRIESFVKRDTAGDEEDGNTTQEPLNPHNNPKVKLPHDPLLIRPKAMRRTRQMRRMAKSAKYLKE